MLSCKNANLMVSVSLDRTLSVRERLGVKLHLLMCSACQRVVAQMKLLRAAARRFGSAEEAESNFEHEMLSKEARARIRERLRNAGDDPRDHE